MATGEVAAAPARVRSPVPIGPLCEQQFRLFGCDIRRGAGNLLAEWGFERRRQASGRPTRYLHQTEIRTIALWGFGMLWIPAEQGPGVFLSRGGRLSATAVRRVPRVRDAMGAARRLGLGPAGDPWSGAAALAWIARYERWVVETAGPRYREDALAETGGCCPAEQIALTWEEHARQLWPGAEGIGREQEARP